MKVGKLSGKVLDQMVLSTIQFQRSDVLVHAGLGEDSAVIDFGDEVCLISSDPITGAVAGMGKIAVHVACNDIAANGGAPIGVQVVLLLPVDVEEAEIKEIMKDVQSAATELGVEVLGGHTEITSKVADRVISITAIGRAPKDQFVTSTGAKPGDKIIITKGAGIEATMILAQDFAKKLPFAISQAEIDFFGSQLSVVPEGLLAAKYGVVAMHDATEGGLLGAAQEICQASKVGATLWEEEIFIPELTQKISDHFKLDPLRLLGAGAMIMVSDQSEGLVKELEKEGIAAFVIGEITEGDYPILVRKNGEEVPIVGYVEDELWRFLAEQAANE